MHWLELSLRTPAESAEAVTAALLDAGCQGVAETGGPERTIVGYLPEVEDLDGRLQELERRLQSLPQFGLPAPSALARRPVDERDWANEWKKHFKPLEIGRRLVIKPTWEPYPPSSRLNLGEPSHGVERVVVELDPGMAFGTGGHQTTRLCLELLEEYVQPGDVVADIGTGSGILALAAARLGAASVLATDIDSLPRKIARENIGRNGLEQVITVHEMEPFDRAAWECDLVVANIIADTIIELTPSICGRLRQGGVFLSSGIVEERLPDVLSALSPAGFEMVEVRSADIWRAVVARRP